VRFNRPIFLLPAAIRNDEIVSALVGAIAAIHLPHMYQALHEIAKRQGISLPETPMVRFVDLNGHRCR
jgi:hypothetical protein